MAAPPPPPAPAAPTSTAATTTAAAATQSFFQSLLTRGSAADSSSPPPQSRSGVRRSSGPGAASPPLFPPVSAGSSGAAPVPSQGPPPFLRQPSLSVQCADESMQRYIKKNFMCAICISMVYEPMQTACAHLFCAQCIKVTAFACRSSYCYTLEFTDTLISVGGLR
jgi:hypothetical protein